MKGEAKKGEKDATAYSDIALISPALSLFGSRTLVFLFYRAIHLELREAQARDRRAECELMKAHFEQRKAEVSNSKPTPHTQQRHAECSHPLFVKGSITLTLAKTVLHAVRRLGG